MGSKHSLVFFTLIELSKILSLYYFLILFYSQSISSSLFLCVSIFSQIHCKTHPTVTAHTHYYQPPLPTPNHQNHKQKQTQNQTIKLIPTHHQPSLVHHKPYPSKTKSHSGGDKNLSLKGLYIIFFFWVWNVK